MTDEERDPMAVRRQVYETLTEMFSAGDIPATWDDGVVRLDGLPLEVGCGDVWLHPNTTIVQLEMCLALTVETDVTLRQAAVGFGNDWKSAVMMALGKWYHTVFVAIAALYDPHGHPGHLCSLAVNQWPDKNGAAHDWTLIASPSMTMQMQGEGDNAPDLETPLASVLGRLAWHERLHWISLFVSRSRGEVVIECSINDRKVPQMQALYEDHAWLADGKDKSVRQFFVFKPGAMHIPETGGGCSCGQSHH